MLKKEIVVGLIDMMLNCFKTNISGVYSIDVSTVEDFRGGFSRLFCIQKITEAFGVRNIVQINHSINRKAGTVRGMHYQIKPFAECKIIYCIKGRVFDVAVDLRKGSNTFLNWYSCELSSKNKKAFVIPEGCAHGYQVLEDNTELLYLHTQYYNKLAERAIRFDEIKVGIDWPLKPMNISKRDMSHQVLSDDFCGVML